MWTYRVGTMQAKKLLFTGDSIDGNEAFRIGLATIVEDFEKLDEAVDLLATKIKTVPSN